ncbi:MAG: sensor histidine kinase [Micrococcaceae bacterium]|nr:sensor histidine kinase [Micrococcaceae bacterium]
MHSTDTLYVAQPSGRHFFDQLGRNFLYVLTGMPIALFSFSLLLSLTVVSIATMVIWVGMVLLPLTLLIASAFAALSRTRLKWWGGTTESVVYRPLGPGVLSKLRVITEPRRWLDLLFETLLALPLRVTNFVVAVTWTFAGLGGITYFFWSVFVPGERAFIQLLQTLVPAIVPRSEAGQYVVDAGIAVGLGVFFLVTLSPLLHGLASFDAWLTRALLGSRNQPATMDRRDDGDAPDAGRQASFSATAWSWTGAIFVSVVLLAVGWPVVAVVYSVNAAVVMGLVILHCAAIVVTLRWTWLGLIISVLASGALMLVTVSAGVTVWPWAVTVLLTQCAVLIVAGMVRPWYYAVSGWCASVIVTIAALLTVAPQLSGGAMTNSIVFASVSAGAVVAATLSRMWIRNAGRLKAAERTSALQNRRSKELTERNRIARELHDVVAHSMSVISVQAATAQYRNPGIDEASQREFDEIASSSRQALAEMRMLLSILRNEDDPPTVATPGLSDIDALIDATRVSGTAIHYRGLAADDDVVSHVAPATGLAAYRTVQEALSNALRHAPGTQVDVTVTTGDDETEWIHIEVTNGPPPRDTAEAPGSGLGLAGIRERTAVVGGTCEAGPTPAGGFAVSANLPV